MTSKEGGMPKVDEVSAFKNLVVQVRFMPDPEERVVKGKRKRKQHWATSAHVILLDKEGTMTKAKDMANGLEEIGVAIKRVLRKAGLTVDQGLIRSKKKPGPKS
jgi:hypothetical protein